MCPSTGQSPYLKEQPGMEHQEIMLLATAWTGARGWRAKLAKRRGPEQTLFEHNRLLTPSDKLRRDGR